MSFFKKTSRLFQKPHELSGHEKPPYYADYIHNLNPRIEAYNEFPENAHKAFRMNRHRAFLFFNVVVLPFCLFYTIKYTMVRPYQVRSSNTC